jgi:hypothetical protein
MGRRGYPLEFRRKVLDLVDAGRPLLRSPRPLGGTVALRRPSAR